MSEHGVNVRVSLPIRSRKSSNGVNLLYVLGFEQIYRADKAMKFPRVKFLFSAGYSAFGFYAQLLLTEVETSERFRKFLTVS